MRALTASSSFGAHLSGSQPTDLRLSGHQLSWREGSSGRRITKTIATGPVHSRRR